EELFKEFQRTGFDMSAPFFKKAHRWGSAFPVTSIARDEKCIWDGTKKLAICGDFCKSIVTYKDDENVKQGKIISDELIKAIEDSKFYVIIFSKNYASSSWCLDELVKIMECQTMDEHAAYPVFYDVEPTEVRKQSGSVGDAFSKHKEDEAAWKWREALKEASELAGWELKSIANGHEAKVIQKIVEEISLESRFINASIDGNLIGMETRVNEVISSLEPGVGDVRMLGIWGMGGAGKTTLARAVFDQISFQFEDDQDVTVSGVLDGKNKMKKTMRGRKVLVVLDDVDDKDQLEALADAIKRLETIPLKKTMEALELSYNGLEEDCKQIFLDVACILKGWEKEEAISVLESRGFRARIGLRVLKQKSLITYDDG
nr:Toll/interleukin-1 receptor (TIR) domain-containing protein [Tanacetum cinerariifolium]